MINVIDNVSDYQTESLTQWDANQKLKISGVSFSTVPAIHFANKKSKKALVITPTLSSGVITVDIPNSLLREPYPIVAFVYSYDNDSGSTELSVTIPIIPRIQPDDYAFIDDGVFYHKNSETVIPRQNTGEENALLAVKKVDDLEAEIASDNVDLDYRLSNIELGLEG